MQVTLSRRYATVLFLILFLFKVIISSKPICSITPAVPQQTGCSDCGIFVCLYVLALFRMRDDSDFSLAKFEKCSELNFGMEDIPRIRHEYRCLISNLHTLHTQVLNNPDSPSDLDEVIYSKTTSENKIDNESIDDSDTGSTSDSSDSTTPPSPVVIIHNRWTKLRITMKDRTKYPILDLYLPKFKLRPPIEINRTGFISKNKTPEQRERIRVRRREAYRLLPPSQKAIQRQKNNDRVKKFRLKSRQSNSVIILTPEEKLRRKRTMQNMSVKKCRGRYTPEHKERILKANAIRRKKKYHELKSAKSVIQNNTPLPAIIAGCPDTNQLDDNFQGHNKNPDVQVLKPRRINPSRNAKSGNSNSTFTQPHPKMCLNSMYVDATENNGTNLAILWCQTEFLEMYDDLILRIAPLCNPAKYTHQTRQPLRIFYSKLNEDTWHSEIKRRVIYGPFGVMSTTGYDMNDFKVLPFTPLITKLVDIIEEQHCVSVSLLEIKAFQGEEVFTNVYSQKPFHNSLGDPLRVRCNDKLGQHNDHNFDLHGVQSPKDTSMGDQNIVTLSIGCTRELTFVHLVTDESQNWKDTGNRDKYCLQHGSIFILKPGDEIPQKNDGLYYKTQHSSKLSGQGLSFAFVFRQVKTCSLFDASTNVWYEFVTGCYRS